MAKSCPAVFGLLSLCHNIAYLQSIGSATLYYLRPKMESHLEARLWNDIFVAAQSDLRHSASAI